MERSEIKIGNQVFHPKNLGVFKKIAVDVGLAIYDIITDFTSPYFEYKRLLDGARLSLFYGKEAEVAFKNLPGVTEPPRRGYFAYRKQIHHPTLGKENLYVWRHTPVGDVISSLATEEAVLPYSRVSTLLSPPHPN